MGEPVGQLAVVGQQNQALAVRVQPPDRVNPLVDRDEIAHGAAFFLALGAGRADHAHRLVEHDVDQLAPGGRLEQLAVDPHLVAG
jgi:hypothetical protein